MRVHVSADEVPRYRKGKLVAPDIYLLIEIGEAGTVTGSLRAFLTIDQARMVASTILAVIPTGEKA